MYLATSLVTTSLIGTCYKSIGDIATSLPGILPGQPFRDIATIVGAIITGAAVCGGGVHSCFDT